MTQKIIKGIVSKEDLLEVKEKGGSRSYNIRDLGPVPSVTSVLHRGFPPGYGLISWFIRSTKEEIDKKREVSLKKGTELHEIFEKFVKANFNEYKLSGEERKKIKGAIQWAKEMKPTLVHSEVVIVYSDTELSVAGRVDLVCVIDGLVWLVDLKTGQGIYEDYPCQVGIYSKALDLKRAGILLLTNTKKGYKFTKVNIEEGFKGFRAAYQIYRYLEDKKYYEKD